MKVAPEEILIREINATQLALTDRQKSILALLAMGKSNKEIGYALQITEGTVKQHLFTLFRKIGVTNRTKAVLRAEELLKSNFDNKNADQSLGPKIARELPHDYAWRMVSVLAVCPKPEKLKTTAQIAKNDRALQILRGEARALVEVYDGQILINPGGAILVGFGAPRSHLDDTARAVFVARKLADWLLKQTDIQAGLGLATAATLVGFGNEPLYRSEAFDLALDLAGRADHAQILATDITCKTAGPIFPYLPYGSKEEARKFVVKEIPAVGEADMAGLVKRVPLPFVDEITGSAQQKTTQWLGVDGWPPSACNQLMDVLSAHFETKRFHTYRLRLATAIDAEQVGANVFQQLKLVARLRERSEGNEPFVDIKTNIMSAVTAMKVLCMRGPTAILVYGVNSLGIMTKAFGEKGMAEIARLPLVIVATANRSDTEPHVTVKLLGNIPGKLDKINAYRLPLTKAPNIPDNINTDLVTMLDMLSPPARHAVRVFVQSNKSAMTTGDKEIGLMIGKELLICGLFALKGDVITYRDDSTEKALRKFFA